MIRVDCCAGTVSWKRSSYYDGGAGKAENQATKVKALLVMQSTVSMGTKCYNLTEFEAIAGDRLGKSQGVIWLKFSPCIY
jgi:hypothetical protein